MSSLISYIKRSGEYLDLGITIEDETVEHVFLFVDRALCRYVSMKLTSEENEEYVSVRLMIESEPDVPILDIQASCVDLETATAIFENIKKCVS